MCEKVFFYKKKEEVGVIKFFLFLEPSDEVPSELIDSVATKVAENWKKMAGSLKLSEKDIKEIEGDSDDDVMRVRI